MASRTIDQPAYRFGFNGKENDHETGTQDYGMRIYNPALGRFLSVDPLSPQYPWYTPYQFAGNQPIWAIDIDGMEQEIIIHYQDNSTTGYTTSKINLTNAGPLGDGVLDIYVTNKQDVRSINIMFSAYDKKSVANMSIPKLQYSINIPFYSPQEIIDDVNKYNNSFFGQMTVAFRSVEERRAGVKIMTGMAAIALAIPSAGQSLTIFGGIEITFGANDLVSGVVDGVDGQNNERNILKEGFEFIGGDAGGKNYESIDKVWMFATGIFNITNGMIDLWKAKNLSAAESFSGIGLDIINESNGAIPDNPDQWVPKISDIEYKSYE